MTFFVPFHYKTLVSMSPEQCKESISLSQLNLMDCEEKVKPYTLEEFSYDHFRYINTSTFSLFLSINTFLLILPSYFCILFCTV